MLQENFIYSPAAAKFQCSVPLRGTRQLFVVDGVVETTGKYIEYVVGKGERPEETTQIISIRYDSKSPDISYKSHYAFEEDSVSKLLLCSHTASQDHFKSDEEVHITVKKGAVADIVLMQNEGNESSHHSKYIINLEGNAFLKMTFLTLHGGEINNNIDISLDGEYAECDISGLYLADKEQRVTNHIHLRHNKPNCKSSQLFKGILDNKAKGAFNGLIYVAPHAQKTEAFQANHNLLTSKEATINTQPQLEIYADDVRCSHGATIGRLNEMELFYMRSRGIPKSEARVLQQLAFASAVLEKIENAELKDRMINLTEKRLRGEFSRCKDCSKNCC